MSHGCHARRANFLTLSSSVNKRRKGWWLKNGPFQSIFNSKKKLCNRSLLFTIFDMCIYKYMTIAFFFFVRNVRGSTIVLCWSSLCCRWRSIIFKARRVSNDENRMIHSFSGARKCLSWCSISTSLMLPTSHYFISYARSFLCFIYSIYHSLSSICSILTSSPSPPLSLSVPLPVFFAASQLIMHHNDPEQSI